MGVHGVEAPETLEGFEALRGNRRHAGPRVEDDEGVGTLSRENVEKDGPVLALGLIA